MKVIVDDDHTTRIRVCGVLDYVVDGRSHAVWVESAPLTRHERASRARSPWAGPDGQGRFIRVDVLNPLCRPAWLLFAVKRPGWFGYTFAHHADGQSHLFVRDDEMAQALQQVISACWRTLRNDRDLQELRLRLVTALTRHIGHGLVDLAMHARVKTRNVSLLASHLNLVWQHEAAFRTMAQESPRLLPVFTAWLAAACSEQHDWDHDPVPRMKQDLLAQGFSPQTWRQLARHGFRPFQLDASDDASWHRLITLLRALEIARWPAVPPRTFLRAMRDIGGLPDDFNGPCEESAGWFWQLMCDEAASARSDTRRYRALLESLPLWARLARKFALSPDKNQRRRGLSWLRRLEQRWARECQSDASGGWATWLAQADWTPVEGFATVPLQSPSDLMQESIALHNCADQYEDKCRNESVVLLSLRRPMNGRRVALACLERKRSTWHLVQLAGPCNNMVSHAVWHAARQAVHVVQALSPEVDSDVSPAPARKT